MKQDSESKLSVVMLHPTHKSYLPLVMIEGDKKSLKELARFLLKLADAVDCGRQMQPRGPANGWFTAHSEMGLYIHRLPCANTLIGEKGTSAAEIGAKNTRQRKPYALKPTPRKRASRAG